MKIKLQVERLYTVHRKGDDNVDKVEEPFMLGDVSRQSLEQSRDQVSRAEIARSAVAV